MDVELLVGAIGALWVVLTTVVGAVIRHLLTDNARLRSKVEASSKLIEDQAAAQAKQIDSMQSMITLLQQQQTKAPLP